MRDLTGFSLSISSKTFGSTDLNNIPIEHIERVEIVTGPISSLYGADAIGGVINVITKKPSTNGGSGAISVAYGSNALQEYGISSSYGTEKHQFGFNINYEDTDGIDRTLNQADGNGDDDGYDQFNVGLSADLFLSEDVNARLNYLYSDSTTEFDSTSGVDPGHFSNHQLEKFSAAVAQTISDDLTINYDLGYFEEESNFVTFFSESVIDRFSLGTNASWLYNDSTTFVAGIDYYDEGIDGLSEDRKNVGIFGQVVYGLGEFSGIGSIRYDDSDAYGTETTGTLALGYDLTQELEIVLSYGTSFRAPTFSALFSPGTGNPDLVPEEGESIELSFKYSYEGVNARLSFYDTEIKELFLSDSMTFVVENVERASLEGVEIELSTEVYDWYLTANLDYLDAVNETTSSRLTDRARVTANLSLQRQFDDLNVLIDWQAETGRIDTGNDIGGYGILGTSLNYDVNDKVSLNLRVDNILDQDYTLNLADGLANPYQTEGRIGKLSLNYRF